MCLKNCKTLYANNAHCNGLHNFSTGIYYSANRLLYGRHLFIRPILLLILVNAKGIQIKDSTQKYRFSDKNKNETGLCLIHWIGQHTNGKYMTAVYLFYNRWTSRPRIYMNIKDAAYRVTYLPNNTFAKVVNV